MSKVFASRLPVALKGAKARVREEKKFLKGTPEALASIYGVTKRTAKNWQAKKQIPPRYRGVIQLLEPEIRSSAPMRRLRTEVRVFGETKKSEKGAVFKTELNAYNDEAVRRAIIAWVYSIKDPFHRSKPRMFNMALIGNAPEEFGYYARPYDPKGRYTAYNTLQLSLDDPSKDRKRGHFKQVVLATFKHEKLEPVLSDMIAQLSASDTLGLFIESLVLYIRVPK